MIELQEQLERKPITHVRLGARVHWDVEYVDAEGEVALRRQYASETAALDAATLRKLEELTRVMLEAEQVELRDRKAAAERKKQAAAKIEEVSGRSE
jgi:hypothetical protein